MNNMKTIVVAFFLIVFLAPQAWAERAPYPKHSYWWEIYKDLPMNTCMQKAESAVRNARVGRNDNKLIAVSKEGYMVVGHTLTTTGMFLCITTEKINVAKTTQASPVVIGAGGLAKEMVESIRQAFIDTFPGKSRSKGTKKKKGKPRPFKFKRK